MKSRLIYVTLIAIIAALVVACNDSSEESSDRFEIASRGSAPSLATEQLAPSQSNVAPAEPADKASASSGNGGSTDLSVDSLQTADRKIVYNANLDMVVGDVDKAVGDALRIASGAGGFLASNNVRIEKGGVDRRLADLTIRVPSSQYQDVLNQLRGLASEVKSETAQSSDVTEEYADLSARVRNLQATENRYVQLLSEAKSIGEILQVQDRINSTRLEIERLQGRMNLLDNLSDLANISVHLEPPIAAAETPSEGGWSPAHVTEEAWDALVSVLQVLASLAIVVAIFSVLIVPLVAIGAFAWRQFGVTRSQS